MRDGRRLTTDVYLPDATGTFPVVLERGYVTGIEENALAFLAAGYAYVGQKARGDLTGNMFFPDADDGYDCLDWVSRQPWCDGNIAMYGRSFHAATQWLAAPEQHPNLKAIIPRIATPTLGNGRTGTMAPWRSPIPQGGSTGRWPRTTLTKPLSSITPP